VIARNQAPAAFTAWDELIDAVASTTPTDLGERARAIARASLDPVVPAVPRSDAMAFAEQMVVDVASMTTDVRAAGLAELGADRSAHDARHDIGRVTRRVRSDGAQLPLRPGLSARGGGGGGGQYGADRRNEPHQAPTSGHPATPARTAGMTPLAMASRLSTAWRSDMPGWRAWKIT